MRLDEEYEYQEKERKKKEKKNVLQWSDRHAPK